MAPFGSWDCPELVPLHHTATLLVMASPHRIVAVEQKTQMLHPPLGPNFLAQPPNKLVGTACCIISSPSNHLFMEVANATFGVNLMWRRMIPMPGFFPSIFHFSRLHQACPNATFVLNAQSDPSTWAKSVLHWCSLTRRHFRALDLEHCVTPPPLPPDAKAEVSHDRIVQDMQRSLDEQILNATDLVPQQGLLEQVRTHHLTKIRQ
jgi:hypothetical protein